MEERYDSVKLCRMISLKNICLNNADLKGTKYTAKELKY